MSIPKYLTLITFFVIVLCKERCKACFIHQMVGFQPAEHREAKLPQKIYDFDNTNVCPYPFVWILQDCITVINAEFVIQATASEKCESIKTSLYDLEATSPVKQAIVMNYVGKIFGWDSYWVKGKNNFTSIIASAFADKRLCHAISWSGIHMRSCDELLGFICVTDTHNRTNVRPPLNEIVDDLANKTSLLDNNHSLLETSTDNNEGNDEGLLLTTVPKSQQFFTPAENIKKSGFDTTTLQQEELTSPTDTTSEANSSFAIYELPQGDFVDRGSSVIAPYDKNNSVKYVIPTTIPIIQMTRTTSKIRLSNLNITAHFPIDNYVIPAISDNDTSSPFDDYDYPDL